MKTQNGQDRKKNDNSLIKDSNATFYSLQKYVSDAIGEYVCYHNNQQKLMLLIIDIPTWYWMKEVVWVHGTKVLHTCVNLRLQLEMYSMYCATINNPIHNLFCKALILKGLYVNFTIFTEIMIQPSGFFFNSGRKWGHESKKMVHKFGPHRRAIFWYFWPLSRCLWSGS